MINTLAPADVCCPNGCVDIGFPIISKNSNNYKAERDSQSYNHDATLFKVMCSDQSVSS